MGQSPDSQLRPFPQDRPADIPSCADDHIRRKPGLMAWEQKRGDIYHIHATGSYEKDRFPGLLEAEGVKPSDDLDVREYINDMPDCLAAADLVISRSGAMTLSELEASGTASILIPSPNVAENHQYHNAMVLAEHDAAVVDHPAPRGIFQSVIFPIFNTSSRFSTGQAQNFLINPFICVDNRHRLRISPQAFERF